MSSTEHQIKYVTNFQDLFDIPLFGEIYSVCWNRKLAVIFGDYTKNRN